MNQGSELLNDDFGLDEIILKAESLLTDIGQSIPKRIAAIEEICLLLSELSPAKQEVYVNEISKRFKVTKKELTEQLKETVSEKAGPGGKRSRDKNSGVPQVTQVENFINDHYDVRFNEISNKIEYRPRDTNGMLKNKWDELNEFNILRRLRKAHISSSQNRIIEILKSDFTPRYNPFREYFKGLPQWDGEDHIKRLGLFLNVEDRKRFEMMFLKMFVRTAACALEQNFNKQVFTLVGKGRKNQNMGKSTFIRWLVPPALKDYYTEELPMDKDGIVALTENFIINLDELSTLKKFEINSLKSLLSKDKVKARLPYDRHSSTLKRRSSFLASTNEARFLTDLTGNVRWVCFNVLDIDFDYDKKINIDKVWSQAYHYLVHGIDGKRFNYQLTQAELIENEKANREFMSLTPEMELIPLYYAPGTKESHQAFYTASDFVKHLTEKTGASVRFYPNTVGKALNTLGFISSEKRIEGSPYPVKGYYIKFLTPDLYGDENEESPF